MGIGPEGCMMLAMPSTSYLIQNCIIRIASSSNSSTLYLIQNSDIKSKALHGVKLKCLKLLLKCPLRMAPYRTYRMSLFGMFVMVCCFKAYRAERAMVGLYNDAFSFFPQIYFYITLVNIKNEKMGDKSENIWGSMRMHTARGFKCSSFAKRKCLNVRN